MKKKNILIITVATLLVVAGCATKKGMAIADPNASFEPIKNGVFSVSPTQKVRFASGNLEYDGFYRFAAHQYDYGGYFGWGTGSNPTITDTNYLAYPTFDDWGNHIEGGWRTLSYDEWKYVLGERMDATDKRGLATVCGVHGLILLPDDWNGGEFHAGFDDGWNTNVYDTDTWAKMESVGAIFLAAAGNRYSTKISHATNFGTYMSSSGNEDPYFCYIGFNVTKVYGSTKGRRGYSAPVRLVQDVTEE